MNIKILGSGCANCVNLEKAAKQAASELGIDATFEKVTDYADIASYGIMRTPGLVVDEEVVLSGRVPTAAQVKELLAPRMSRPARQSRPACDASPLVRTVALPSELTTRIPLGVLFAQRRRKEIAHV